MRAPTGNKKKRKPRAAPTILSARISAHVALDARSNGEIVASFGQYSINLGQFGASVANRVHDLRAGIPLGSFGTDARSSEEQIQLLLRRLAGHGFLEYRLGPSQNGSSEIVIEPQVPEYWPRLPAIDNADALVLSRFAYMRRRANEMLLESPRAGASFRICNPKIAATMALLATPQQLDQLRRQDDFPGVEVLALLVDCQILLKIDPDRSASLRLAEGNEDLVLWDFHDLLFHTRSTVGRHANPVGGLYPYAGVISAPPAVRPCWPGKKIDLSRASIEHPASVAKLLRLRHSTRVFDDEQPITLAEISGFLDGAARVQSTWTSKLDPSEAGPVVAYAARPYPSGGGSCELELYLAVNKCDGLARGFFHYDAGGHALVPIAVRPHELEALLMEAEFAMAAPAAPQILITIAARFGRISWKYSSLAYALILKDVGVLTQTLYLMATDMGLGGCAIGSTNIDLFAQMTGLEFHVEGAVGQFAIGRGAKASAAGEPHSEPSV